MVVLSVDRGRKGKEVVVPGLFPVVFVPRIKNLIFNPLAFRINVLVCAKMTTR